MEKIKFIKKEVAKHVQTILEIGNHEDILNCMKFLEEMNKEIIQKQKEVEEVLKENKEFQNRISNLNEKLLEKYLKISKEEENC